MSRKDTIRVVGTSSVGVVPDRADVQFEVHAREGVRRKAYDRAAAMNAKLNETLDRFEIPPSRRQTRAVLVTEIRDPKSGAIKGYDATSRVFVRLEGEAVAGQLIEAAVRDAGATVIGPRWSVGPDHPGRLDAYREAARDAAERARAYVEGLGLEVGEVLRVEEGQTAISPRLMAAMPLANQRFGSAAPEPIELDPGEVELTAAVTVDFLLVKTGNKDT